VQTQRAACVGGILLSLLVAAGCAPPTTAEVSGTVKIDGQLVKRGSISFYPLDGNSPTAGGTITDGHYSVMVPITTMQVRITAPKVVGRKKLYDTPDSPEKDILVDSLPARYNTESELTLEVKPGKNHKDFELQSQ
jgi:hypothetical protein